MQASLPFYGRGGSSAMAGGGSGCGSVVTGGCPVVVGGHEVVVGSQVVGVIPTGGHEVVVGSQVVGGCSPPPAPQAFSSLSKLLSHPSRCFN